jgi:hypothetical protein
VVIISRLSKVLDMNARIILHCGLIYPLPSYGIIVWGQNANALSLLIKGYKVHSRVKMMGIM